MINRNNLKLYAVHFDNSKSVTRRCEMNTEMIREKYKSFCATSTGDEKNALTLMEQIQKEHSYLLYHEMGIS